MRLSDFRLARLTRSQGLYHIGASEYGAPELRTSGTPVPASDVYAVAAVMHAMLTGAPPPAGAPGHAAGSGGLERAVAQPLEDVLRACLDQDPSARPSAIDLAAYLTAVAQTPAKPPARPARVAPPPTPLPSPLRGGRGRGRRGAAILASSLGAAAITATTLILVPGTRAPAGDAAAAPMATAEWAAPHPMATDVQPVGDVSGIGAVASASAFARDWFATLSAAVEGGSTAALAAASDPECAACSSAISAIDSAHKNGGHFTGGTYTVHELVVDNFFTVERASLTVVFDRAPRSSIDGTGRLRVTTPGVSFQVCQMVLERLGDRWRAREVLSATAIV